jgi:hypothetical protein
MSCTVDPGLDGPSDDGLGWMTERAERDHSSGEEKDMETEGLSCQVAESAHTCSLSCLQRRLAKLVDRLETEMLRGAQSRDGSRRRTSAAGVANSPSLFASFGVVYSAQKMK